MFDISPFEPEDVVSLIEEPMNSHLKNIYSSGWAASAKKSSVSFTGRLNNEIYFCLGVVTLWAKRGYLWTILSEKIKNKPTPIYRNLRKIINKQYLFDRIEMDVPVDLEIAHKRASFMGFKLECALAKKYSPEGEDRALYAWVRG